MTHLVDTDSEEYDDYSSGYSSHYVPVSEGSFDESHSDGFSEDRDDDYHSGGSESDLNFSGDDDDTYRDQILHLFRRLHREENQFNKVENRPVDQLERRITSYWSYDWYEDHPTLKNQDKLQLLKDTMSLIYSRRTIVISIDVGVYEHSQKYLTEIGLSIYDPRGQQLMMTPNTTNIHIRIEDNKDLRNKDFIPNKSDYFMGGSTLLLNLDEAIDLTQGILDHYSTIKNWPCCLIGHSLKSTIDKLEYQGVEFPEDVNELDTKEIFMLSGDKTTDSSLRNALRVVNLPHAHLRNAGNDAYYTFLLASKLADPDAREYYRLDDWNPGKITKRGPTRANKFSDKSVVVNCKSAVEAAKFIIRN